MSEKRIIVDENFEGNKIKNVSSITDSDGNKYSDLMIKYSILNGQ